MSQKETFFLTFHQKVSFRGPFANTVIDHLNQIMKYYIVPEKQLSIDESMMLWRGHLMFRQYLKNKHTGLIFLNCVSMMGSF